jgi:hypothetical protein
MLHEMPNSSFHLSRSHENGDLSQRSLKPSDGSVVSIKRIAAPLLGEG